MIVVTVIAIGIHWTNCVLRANAATKKAKEAMESYRAQTVTSDDVVLACQEALDADLAVPLRPRRDAYESQLRRLGEMRLYVESMYPGSGQVRPIVEFTSHYELARRRLANIAGESYADRVDREFRFFYRDQVNGHPASERGI
jgi:hypothetical protein